MGRRRKKSQETISMNSIDSRVQREVSAIERGRLTGTLLVLVTGLLGLSYAFNALDRHVFPALLGGIRTTYGLTLAQAGFVSTVFTVNIALFGALSGWFLKRFTRKSILVGGLVGYSLFTIATPLAQGFATLAAYRALTGVGEALQITAIYACLGSYFGQKRGAAMGVMLAFYGFGALAGPVIGTHLNEHVGSWQLPFYIFGIAGIVVALAVAFLLPSSFTEAQEGGTFERESPLKGTFTKPRLFNRNVCLGAISFSLIGLSLFSYLGLYTAYLREHLNYSPVAAGTALGMYGVGAMGAAVGGWAGDRLGKRGMFACLLMLVVISFLLFNSATSPITNGALSFAFGLMISGYCYARFVSVIQRSAHPDQIEYSVSIAMASFYLSGPFAGYLFGKLASLWGWSSAANLLVVAPPCIAIALMCFFDFSKLRGT
jgi:MFS transporter, DHA1 family, inner membrane transport protein